MKRSDNSQKMNVLKSSMCLEGLIGFVLCLLVPSMGWGYSGGSGTVQSPYVLSNADDLIQLSLSVKDYDKHFLMAEDIDLAGRSFSQAVIAPYHEAYVFHFAEDSLFTGTINGNGHVIRNFSITGENNIGLFGALSEAGQIFGVGIEGANIVGTGRNAGMLVGLNAGRIRQCYASGTVLGEDQVGGLVGGNYDGRVENCFAEGRVSGASRVGGLVGGSGGYLVLNSFSTCWMQIVPGSTSTAGGLVGSPFGEILNSFWDTETSGVPSDGQDTGASGGLGGGGTGGGRSRSLGAMGLSMGTGTGLETALMHDPQTFLDVGWDFVGEIENGLGDIWMMLEAGGYPVLGLFYGVSPGLPFDHGSALGRCILSDDPNEVMWNGSEVFDVDWDRAAVAQVTKNQDKYPDQDPNDKEFIISLSGSVDILDATNLIGIDARTGVVCQVLDEHGVAVPLKDPLSPFEPALCWDVLSQTLSQFELQFQIDSHQAMPSRLSQVDFYVYTFESDLLVTIEVPFEAMDNWIELVPGFEMIIESVTIEEGTWAYTMKEKRTLNNAIEDILTPNTVHCEQENEMELYFYMWPLTDVDLIFNRRIVDEEGNLAERGNHNSSRGSSIDGGHLTVMEVSGTGVHNIAAIEYVVALAPYKRIVPLTLKDIPVTVP